MEFKKTVYRVQDGIAWITMNYSKNMNAIDEQMADELNVLFDRADQDEAVNVIVLEGTEKAFSAGGDIGFFYDKVQSGGKISLDGLLARVGTLADKMKRMGKLIITSVCGVAAGAGVSLALGGDFLVCDEKAKLILAFVNLGLVPDTGAVYLLSRSIGAARALELAATGRPITAQEAKELGLVYQVVPRDELHHAVEMLAIKLASGPAVAYKNMKKQVYEAAFSDYKNWLDSVEIPTQRHCALTEDFKEGVKAFMEKRKPSFTGR